jgi:hypothetical protein
MIPTIFGPKEPDEGDRRYMDYLDECYDAPSYGLLMFKGDPTAFSIGKAEWLAEEDEEEDGE